MKQVVLVRHAESEWAAPFEKDLDRSLTEQGKTDTKNMAAALQLHNISPDKIYSSPARRAIQTAEIFIKALDFKKREITVDALLYTPSVRNFYDVIEHIPDEFDTVIIFSHNPGISDFVQEIECCPDVQMPTCGMVALEADTESWTDFRASEKKFLFFTSPHQMMHQ